MALVLPLQLIDSISFYVNLTGIRERVTEFVVNKASIFEVIKWQSISRTFETAVQKRLKRIRLVEIRLWPNLKEIRERKEYLHNTDWHPNCNLMVVQLDPHHLTIAIDPKPSWKDIKSLINLLTALKQNIEHLYIDSPVIEILVAEVSNQQIQYIISNFPLSKKPSNVSQYCSANSWNLIPVTKSYMPEDPFFPSLRSLSIVSQSDQIEHLSRLLGYSVSVDLLYHVQRMELLSLKICIGKRWCFGRNPGIFRHLMRFNFIYLALVPHTINNNDPGFENGRKQTHLANDIFNNFIIK